MEIDFALGLIWFTAFLLSTTVHEAMHALAAWRLGDPTAYEGGQVSLNPAPHVAREPIGMVVLPLLTSLTQGWASVDTQNRQLTDRGRDVDAREE
jgi:Zn-dependent protease